MLFNSFEFFVFLPTIFFFYWFVFNNNLRLQNLLLLISGYVFYGWWDWRFLSLIFLSTIVDYYIGLKIYCCDEIKLKKKISVGEISFLILDCIIHFLNTLTFVILGST